MPASREQARARRPRRRGLTGRRVAVAGALAATLSLAAGGCSSFSAALGKQEAVVHFRPRTPVSVRLQVRAACSHERHAVPEPLPTDHIVSDTLNNVRYRVDHASDADLARLQQCLQKFPSVTGIEFSAPNGS